MACDPKFYSEVNKQHLITGKWISLFIDEFVYLQMQLVYIGRVQ